MFADCKPVDIPINICAHPGGSDDEVFKQWGPNMA